MNEDSVIVIDRQEERKKRGALAVILAIAFIALLGIGSTFAYLTWTANQTPNRTTMGELTADLLEPTYTNAAITDNYGVLSETGVTTAPVAKAVTSGTAQAAAAYWSADGRLIPAGAANMIPSSEFQKNPFVVNTTKAKNAVGFAGLKVQFQKWNKTTKGDTDATTKWTNMTADEVAKLLKVYSISSNPNSTTAGLTIGNGAETTKQWKSGAVNTEVENVTDNDAGTTSNKWVQLKGKSGDDADDTDYGVLASAATGTANSSGAMYFVNFNRLVSMDNDKASDKIATTVGSTSRQAVKDGALNEKTNDSTWGYQADDIADGSTKYENSKFAAATQTVTDATELPSSTSPLFQYVRYLDNAAQEDIDALMNVLDPLNVKLDYKSGTSGPTVDFTPGWRMVISAAIIQTTSPADVTGTATGYTSYTDTTTALITLNEGVATANTGSTWFKQFKGVLDEVGTGTASTTDSTNNVNRTDGSKPIAATGYRENVSKNGNWYYVSGMGTDQAAITGFTGDGVPESSNIGKKTGDTSATDGTQVGGKDYNGNTTFTETDHN